MKLELISFALCPFVQRSVITLKHKKADYKITLIDLKNPPTWFEQISPLSKVPVLKVNDDTIIFESAVINELIDETHPPSLMPIDPIAKEKERTWIEYGSSLLSDMFELMMETDHEAAKLLETELFQTLSHLEKQLGDGPFFRGKEFSLVDTSYAPMFQRLFLAASLKNHASWSKLPKTKAWGESLLKLPDVKDSVTPTFERDFINYCKQGESYLFI